MLLKNLTVGCQLFKQMVYYLCNKLTYIEQIKCFAKLFRVDVLSNSFNVLQREFTW